MKKCNKCNTNKEFSEFHVASSDKSGYRGTCKECIIGHKPHNKNVSHKICNTCGYDKEIELYPFTVKDKGYRSSKCRKCTNNRRDFARKLNREKESLREKNKRLKYEYGISINDYNMMIINQDGKCKICKKSSSETLSVDHCHDSLKVRGLLCRQCNSVIGMAKDNTDILRSAILYLENSRT